jgi:transcriptional antiterminator NusG
MSSSTTCATATARWYALAVHARSEQAAARDLHGVVDEVFVPVSVERRAWTDRVKRVEVPLFPGYVFVRLALSPQRRVRLLKCRGVVDVVGRSAERPDVAPSVGDDIIAALQRLVASERALDPVTQLVPGRTVVVGAGPLRGIHGVVEEAADGHRRLVVQVALLGRSVRTTLQADDVLVGPSDPAVRG